MKEIKKMYSQLEYKKSFLNAISKELNKSTNTLRNHWFSTNGNIPEEYQPRVKEILKRLIKKQNEPI